MKTEVIRRDSKNIDLEKIRRAAEVIKKGGVVAFPTETVYGLAADFLNKQAVNRIFEVKKRPKDKPLTVQIQDITYLEELATDIPAFAYQLMNKFWPGPLTLVLPACPEFNSAGRQAGEGGTSPYAEVLPPSALGDSPPKPWRRRTVGVRIPDNKIAQSMVKESETPLVVPSANLSGEPAAKTAEEVLQAFDGLIEMVIDGGKVELGIASTVIDLSVSPYRILREGAISQKDIQDVQG